MKINVASNGLFTGVLEKNASPVRTLTEKFNEKNENPVQVTISDKGQEYYKKSIQELIGDDKSYDVMIENRNKLLETHLSTDIDYDFQLGGEVNKYKQEGVHLATKEKADDLLKAYASLYDEIVQGYGNGTREIHVEDESSEVGYRILTQDEEINALNNSYGKYAVDLETQAKQEPEIQRAFERYMKKISKMGVEKPSMAQNYYDNVYLKEKDEIILENVSKKMEDAVSIFREKYTTLANLSDLLAAIKVF